MQTRPDMHVELPDVLAELGESAQEQSNENHLPTTDTQSGTVGFVAANLEPQTAAVSEIEHVVVLDLTAPTAPGVAGLEGVLPSSHHEWLDRLMNIVLAGLALLIAMPVMLLTAIAIKLTSKGPVFYRQPRIGLNRRGNRSGAADRRGEARSQLWARFVAQHDDHRARDLGGDVFMIYKFRSMCEDAEAGTGVVWASKKDPRATKIGCFLRKYRLDELPQFINVLKGDMNIVGPRPERPSIFARMRETIVEYPLRQLAKPGITGLAQIKLFYDSCVDDVRKKVRYDLEYLRNKSVTKDLTIMARTLPAMLFKRRGW
jgi:lipopolysaccharide/colanic/teichoic acid biosynthesis glycosyltransferase